MDSSRPKITGNTEVIARGVRNLDYAREMALVRSATPFTTETLQTGPTKKARLAYLQSEAGITSHQNRDNLRRFATPSSSKTVKEGQYRYKAPISKHKTFGLDLDYL
eukprot:IDg13660t1